MCDPCTRRTFALALTPARCDSTSSTQGPPALTSARALMVSCGPVIVSSHGDLPAIVGALGLTARVRVRMTAPRSAASSAFKHHQPRIIDETVGIFEAALEASRRQRTADFVLAQVDVSAPAATASGRRDDRTGTESEPQQPGRPRAAVMGQNEAQRRMIWGAICQSTSLAPSALHAP